VRAGRRSACSELVGRRQEEHERIRPQVVFDVDSTVPSDALIVIVDSDFSGM
jgi:hypothetical protein